jgi:hypothetical protein
VTCAGLWTILGVVPGFATVKTQTFTGITFRVGWGARLAIEEGRQFLIWNMVK